MMKLTFVLFTQVSDSGPHGPLISLMDTKIGIFTSGEATSEKLLLVFIW